MKRSTIYAAISIAVCVIGVIWLLFFSWKPDKSGDPAPIVSETAAADALGYAQAIGNGASVSVITDTGSMRPYLTGGDYVVLVKDYAGVKVGKILAYWPDYKHDGKNPIIHRAAQQDSGGWIMSGDSAPHTESWARVTEKNYIGTLDRLYRQKK